MIAFEQDELVSRPIATIKIVGVGGAGGNTVNSIIESGHRAVDCIVINTDVQALDISRAVHKIQIGITATKGLGTGSNPEIGKKSAEEDINSIAAIIGDADIVFLSGGMGGGTGSGALPVIARMLKEKGILCIALVTKPFEFEGKRRGVNAMRAIEALSKEVDTLIVVPNQKLLEYVDQTVSIIDAFAMINDVLCKAVHGISTIITRPGHINVDFADVRTIMKDRGLAIMGTGKASGKHRAREATLQALSSPLLENMSMKGAHGVLLNITGGRTLALHEIQEAAELVYKQADEDAHIILGSVIDDLFTDEVEVTIIATGLSLHQQPEQVPLCAKEAIRVGQNQRLATHDAVVQNFASQQALSGQDQVESSVCGVSPATHDTDINFDIPAFLRNRTDVTENFPLK